MSSSIITPSLGWNRYQDPVSCLGGYFNVFSSSTPTADAAAAERVNIRGNPPASEVSREVANLTERKNYTHTCIWCQRICLSVCLSVVNFDPNYFNNKHGPLNNTYFIFNICVTAKVVKSCENCNFKKFVGRCLGGCKNCFMDYL